MNDPRRPDSSREDQARAELKALSAADDVFSSATARAGRHLAGADADQKDAAELWGTRVGRGLSLVGFVVLAGLLGRQLGWW